MSTIIAQTDTALATRLRLERESRFWTLADLAARSGISKAMLSKIERGEASPTAALLGRLSAAYGLTISQLFARAEQGGQLARKADQPIWMDPATGFVRRSLSPPAGAPMELVWGELPPGARIAYPADSYRFIADHQVLVVDGTLTMDHAGTVFVLSPGDCLRWGTPRDVTYENAGKDVCRYIVAVLRASA
jgi:transcriptional regulator with XRE-family HTH domain